jgi:cobalt-zinc-cadmium efflux system outer membrane protein
MNTAAIQRDIVALDLLANVAKRFIANLADQAKVEIAQEHVARARQVLESVRVRVNAGVGSPLEEGNATVHLREMEIALSAAEGNLRRSWALLAATWGAPANGTGRADGDLNALPALPDFATFAAKIEKNPQVARFAAERLAAGARARLAQANRTPDVTVSAGVRRLEALNDQALVLGFSVPLNSAGRNAAAVREADARLSQATYGETAARLESMATLFGLYEQAQQARATFSTLRESSLPVAEQTLRRAEEGFRAGRFSLFEVSAAQEQYHGTEESIVEAAETYHQAITEIERLTNEPIEIRSAASEGVTP